MITQVRRWLPERSIVVVVDSSFADLEWLDAALTLPMSVHLVTRLRLDAALYQPAPVRQAKPDLLVYQTAWYVNVLPTSVMRWRWYAVCCGRDDFLRHLLLEPRW